tara:strand:- start:328 stop:1746 length:1419 start_codon:yes stop_codon:yes gene_type:complete
MEKTMLSENYKKYFKMMMDKYNIKDLNKLSSDEKKRFFTAVDKNYKAKKEGLKEMTPPMSVSNPKAHATLVQRAVNRAKERQLPGTKTKLGTALQNKNHDKHSLAKKIIDKIKRKKKDKPKTNISKSDAQKYADLFGGGAKVESIDEAMSNRVKKAIMIAVQMGGNISGAVKKIEKIKKGLSKDKKVMQALRLANENVAPNHDGKAAPHGSGYEEMDEAKIQVQGIGMYDDKTLKKKIIQLASELQKNAKSGNWNKASENGIRALGRMWGAYQDYARNNESVTEMNSPMFKITYKDSLGRKKTDIMRAKNPKLAKRDFDALHTGRGFKILKVVKESVNEDVFAIVDKYNDKKQDYDQVYFKDNNLNKVKKHMKKMGSKYGKMNLIQVKPNGKMSLVEDTDIGHQDDEPNMLKKTSLEIMEYGKKLYDKLDYYDDMNNEIDFPTWWQSKLIISKEYLQKAYHYLDSEEKTDES